MQSSLERTTRIDAEFYQKESFAVLNLIDKMPHCPLTTYVDVSDGNHMSISDSFVSKGIPYYRGQDVKSFFIENNSPICVDEKSYNQPYMRRSHLKKGDVLLSIVGTIGSLAVVSSSAQATCSCKLAILRPRKSEDSDVLALFLRCKYGQNQIKKFTRGTVQMGLILEDMEQLVIPEFQDDFKNILKKAVANAFDQENAAKQTYLDAENLLLSTLCVGTLPLAEQSISVKSLSESFSKSGRLDAEYYQPKYDDFEHLIKRNGYVIAEDICSEINYGTVPTSPYSDDGTGVPYIKGMNIKNTLVDDIETLDRITNTEGLPQKYYTKAGDIIISQMGTVADCGVITKEQENWLFASFTIRLRLKESANFNPFYIGLYIQLLAKPYYFYRNIAQASVRQNTDLPTVRKMYVPKMAFEKQVQIANQIRESFALQRQSKQLLENAKRAVEIAIEQSEEKAIQWLKEKRAER